MCGKNYCDDFSIVVPTGSPPRVREKPLYCLDCQRVRRITPACAGKTWSLQSCSNAIRDHPRVCGKNSGKSFPSASTQGSPPRVREKRLSSLQGHSRSGITPACAGKTPFLFYLENFFRDHPRVCGKNLLTTAGTSFSTGSPPRVREKLKQMKKDRDTAGITPACAGKTIA